MALTVPTQGNQFRAVSMYSADNQQNMPLNTRATALMQACGHAPPSVEGNEPGVYGDVFVGRCYDDEQKDEWQRVDILASEIDPAAPWCANARSKGGGGGSGSAAASLSGVMSQAMGQPNVTWNQTDDEVEIKCKVASGTKGQDVKVNFSLNALTVTVAGDTLIQGPTGGRVAVDESTYTLQDAGDARELCVVLGKNEAGTTWPYAVESK